MMDTAHDNHWRTWQHAPSLPAPHAGESSAAREYSPNKHPISFARWGTLARAEPGPPHRCHHFAPEFGTGEPPVIAIVDDDPLFTKLVEDFLRDEGFATIMCATAGQVSPRLGLAHPGLIILDL